MENLFQTIRSIESQSNFTFIVDDEEIPCNRLFASFISPSITKNFQTDKKLNSFKFHIDDFTEAIKSYYNLILGTSLDLTSTDQQDLSKDEIKSKIQEKLLEIIQKTCQLKIEDYISTQNQEETSMIDYLILLKIFKSLGNDSFVHKLNVKFDQYLQFTNQNETQVECEEEIIERIQIKEKIGINYSNEIEYIKNHFCEIDTNILNEIDFNLIEAAITQKDFQIPDEDAFLYQILEMKRRYRLYFLQFVQFPNLSVRAVQFFLKEVDFNEIDRNLWNSIMSRLLLPNEQINNTIRYSEPMKFEYTNGHEFDGIINFLNKKCGGNSHLKGLIQITSSDEKLNHCYNLIDPNFNSTFCTNAGYDSFIQFDFQDFRISINGYAMKTIGVLTGKFVTWAIWGSNDQKKWDIISNIHINAWPGYDNVSIVPAKCHNFYRYIQIKMTGPNAAGSFDLYLTSIEFFGLMKTCKRNKYNQS